MAATLSTFRQTTARVARQEPCGGDHWWLDLDVDEAFVAPEPGQFVQLLLGTTATSTFLPRPMSVARVERLTRGLRLGFLYAPVGIGTLALSRLRAGDTADVLGPLGHGYPLEEPGLPVLVAGGRGVAPLLFTAEALARAGRRSALLFGARSTAQLVACDDAERRVAAAGGTLHLATDDGSSGFRGDVVRLLDSLARGWTERIVIHACGPHGMLKALAQWSLARGVRAHLAMESVMACGTGVCRGCPLPRSAAGKAAWSPEAPSLLGNAEHAMCCTEGPVFEAHDLDWERVH